MVISLKFAEVAICPPPSRTQRVILKLALSCSCEATNEERNVIKQTIEINLRLSIADHFFYAAAVSTGRHHDGSLRKTPRPLLTVLP